MKSPNIAQALLLRLGTVPRTWLLGGIAAGILSAAIAIAFLLFGGNGDDPAGATESPFQAQADSVATALASGLAPYRKVLNDLATHRDVATTLRDGDEVARRALASRLTPALDGVLALRVLPAAWRDPDPSATPPLTYAAVSMVIQARETGADVPAEAHLVGSSDEQFEILKRVEGAGAGNPQLAGFLLLTVKFDIVRQALMRIPLEHAYVEIRQSPGGSIAATGIKPEHDRGFAAARVPGTRFAVAYMAAGSAPAGAADSGHPMMWPLVGLGLLGGLGLAALLHRRRHPRVVIATQSVIYQGAIKAILDGAHPGLEQLLPGAKRGTSDIDLDVFGDRAESDDVTRIKGAPALPASEDPTIPRAAPAAIGIEPVASATPAAGAIARSIFRTYDIRGIVGDTLTEDGVYQIGRALGAEADQRGQKTVVVARDGRHSSEPLMQALTKGLLESGRDVLDIGLAPTPVLYFATHHLDAHSGVMITGSHNSAEYNGLKIVLDGETLSGDAIQAIRRRVDEQDYIEGTGSLQSADIVAEYIRRISEEIPVTLGNALKVVVDCGNGVPGMVAPAILRAIGHDVIELFCDVDGDFPNHHPDPSQPENLAALIAAVEEEGADLGLAFDGDGDRLGVVDNEGNIIWPDRQMILFARDILSRNPGAKIIYDVKCSRLLADAISAAGGEPIMTKTGHSLIKARMVETGALLAGEMSGHIFFKERWYGFDDALYAAARLLEILVNSGMTPAQVFAELPGGVATPELRLDMPEEQHAAFMEKVLAAVDFEYAEITTIDGLRVDFVDSWGVVRPSNTTPCLVLRFEGDNAEALAEVQERFRKLLKSIDSRLKLPF